MEHNLFYYPYACLTHEQLPLLKVIAHHFDNLFILDSEKATGGAVELGNVADEIAMPENGDVDVLQRVAPEEVLETYEDQIARVIRADMTDDDFLRLCASSGRGASWTIHLAKVPRAIREDPEHGDYTTLKPRDRAMQRLMGDVPRNLLEEGWSYFEEYAGVYAQSANSYMEQGADDEQHAVRGHQIEYRYADFPLPLGESIMMNHALFAGLLHSSATPITDDPFHNEVFDLKLRRVFEIPEMRRVLSNRLRRRNFGSGRLVASALTDPDLKLPVLSPDLPMEEVLKYRRDHEETLAQVREKLGILARRIESEPWSAEFASELEHKTIPDLIEELNKVRIARDDWLQSERGKHALKAVSVGVAAASAVLTLIATPVVPIALATASLGIVSGVAIPGLEWVNEWKEDKAKQAENGLRYLLMM